MGFFRASRFKARLARSLRGLAGNLPGDEEGVWDDGIEGADVRVRLLRGPMVESAVWHKRLHSASRLMSSSVTSG